MTKEEAYNAMQKGYPISHKNLSPDEFLWMDDNYIIKDEEGNEFEESWDVTDWATGWYIFKKKTKNVIRPAIPFKRKEEYEIEEKSFISHMPGTECAGKESCLQYNIAGETACVLCDCNDKARIVAKPSSNSLLQMIPDEVVDTILKNGLDFDGDTVTIKPYKKKNIFIRVWHKIKRLFRRNK